MSKAAELRRQGGQPVFEVAGQPLAVDAELRPLPEGTTATDTRYLAVSVRNTSDKVFDTDLLLDISDCGRDALADHGVLVRDSWTPKELRTTGQEVFERGVNLPPLNVGEQVTLYFQIDGADARAGTPDVEFVLFSAYDLDKPIRADHSSVHPVAITGEQSDDEPAATPPEVALAPGVDVVQAPRGEAGAVSVPVVVATTTSTPDSMPDSTPASTPAVTAHARAEPGVEQGVVPSTVIPSPWKDR